jgi:hypothetical protein
MRRCRFKIQQTIGVLQEHERVAKIAEVCSTYGVTQTTFHRSKRK